MINCSTFQFTRDVLHTTVVTQCTADVGILAWPWVAFLGCEASTVMGVRTCTAEQTQK